MVPTTETILLVWPDYSYHVVEAGTQEILHCGGKNAGLVELNTYVKNREVYVAIPLRSYNTILEHYVNATLGYENTMLHEHLNILNNSNGRKI